jgi:ribose transport system permease protein
MASGNSSETTVELSLKKSGGQVVQSRFLRTIEMRFAAIWIALVVMLLLDRLFLPRSVDLSTLMAILPLAAFLAIAAMGQTLVIMSKGIDLSVPAIVSLSSAVLLGVSGGSDERLLTAIIAALAAAILVGAANGFLIAAFKLNALIVTLATGSIVTGITIGYRETARAESTVPQALADFCSSRVLGIPTSVWVALILVVLLTFVQRKSFVGRRFELVGINPAAAHVTGVATRRYEGATYVAASALYGVMAILLAGFIRNPTLEVGNPYLLAPIAAAVLGGTAISGGIGSLISVCGAALFLLQLDQSIKMLGLPTAWQMIIQGVAIALGMYLSGMSLLRKRR